MYLADALLRSTSRDHSISDLRSGMANAELFAVEASAMTLCHDLRLESASQMERIAGIICSQQRTIFAEASTKVLTPLLKRTMYLNDEMAKDLVQNFPRLGVLMYPVGTGLVLTLAWVNGHMPHRKWSRAWRDHVVGVGTWRVHLNVDEPYPFQSPKAMQAAAFYRSEVEVGIQAFNQGGIDYDTAVHMAWMTNRLLALGGTPDQEARGWDGILRSAVISIAISLGAILQVEAPELKREPRKLSGQSQGRAQPTKRAQVDDRPVDDRLSIVTLRLTDPEMKRWYETPAQAERRSRRSTARHLVRGHVFATRWGGIAWRKPHWRGDPNKKVLHRVT